MAWTYARIVVFSCPPRPMPGAILAGVHFVNPRQRRQLRKKENSIHMERDEVGKWVSW
jgi:hypothetical protein